MSHSREDDTYPRLAVPLGWVAPEHVVDVVEAVDHRAARLGPPRRPPAGPPQVHDRGARHRARSAPRSAAAPASSIAAARRAGAVVRRGLPRHPRRRRRAARAVGQGRRPRRRRSCARRCASSSPTALVTKITVTGRQDLLLHGIRDGRTDLVEDRLRAHGVKLAGDVSALRRLAIACPALPTCGQALGEAERVLPDLVTELEKALADSGNGDAPIRLNMTGCPNGCARPYNGEIGIVGRTKKGYDLYVGGSATGDRMGQRIRTDVPLDQLAATLAPVFAAVRRPRRQGARRSATGRTASAPRRSPRGCPSRSSAAEPPGPAAEAADRRPVMTVAVCAGRRRARAIPTC